MLKPNIQDDTALRLQELTEMPLTKGFDKQVNALCDELEELREKNGPTIDVCDTTEATANGEE